MSCGTATFRTIPDQGVVILVEVGGETALRFNCFDIEKSYVYGPEGKNVTYRMDHTVDGNPIGWSVKTIPQTTWPVMLAAAGYADAAAAVDQDGPWRRRCRKWTA